MAKKQTKDPLQKLLARTTTRKAKPARMKKVTAVHRRIKRRVKLAVIPHKANQYRPHLIRRYGLAAVLVLVLAGQIGINVITRGSVLGERSELTATGLLAYTNTERSDRGEAPLTMNTELSRAAELKVQNMFKDQYWAHNAPDGTTPWHWFGAVGYDYSEAGENLAKNFTTDDSTVAAWMASPTHRANILNGDYRDAGFAIAHGSLDGEPTTLVVALYGKPIAESAVAGVEASSDQTMVSKTDTRLGFLSRFELGVGELTPVAVAGIIVLLILANLALLAQAYRDKLPKAMRSSWWYRHHGIYKAFGILSVVMVIVLTYGSVGQI